jgi:microcystin-dependent protein
MSCESCYNGCVETVSDQCVRYTGLDSIALDIQSGDNLQTVLQNIIDGLVPLFSGTGDQITLSSAIRCAIINGYLPTPSTPNQWTSEQIFQALTKVVCNLDAQITVVEGDIATLNANYTIECLTGVTASSDTHDIVQAIITKLCATASSLTALALDVDTNYVKLADLDALIAAYLASQTGSGSNQQYLKMVPYVAYEYYGPLTNFDGTGAGINANGFYKVYLCNGLNGTPDKRGRVAVGAIANVPPVGVGLDAAVNPANPGNPNYAVYNTAGANTVTLITAQIPSHSHAASVVASGSVDNHTHVIMGGGGPGSGSVPNSTQVMSNETAQGGNSSYKMLPANVQSHNSGITSASGAGPVSLSIAVTNANTGSNESHANIQPVIAAYYIMYIP